MDSQKEMFICLIVKIAKLYSKLELPIYNKSGTYVRKLTTWHDKLHKSPKLLLFTKTEHSISLNAGRSGV